MTARNKAIRWAWRILGIAVCSGTIIGSGCAAGREHSIPHWLGGTSAAPPSIIDEPKNSLAHFQRPSLSKRATRSAAVHRTTHRTTSPSEGIAQVEAIEPKRKVEAKPKRKGLFDLFDHSEPKDEMVDPFLAEAQDSPPPQPAPERVIVPRTNRSPQRDGGFTAAFESQMKRLRSALSDNDADQRIEEHRNLAPPGETRIAGPPHIALGEQLPGSDLGAVEAVEQPATAPPFFDRYASRPTGTRRDGGYVDLESIVDPTPASHANQGVAAPVHLTGQLLASNPRDWRPVDDRTPADPERTVARALANPPRPILVISDESAEVDPSGDERLLDAPLMNRLSELPDPFLGDQEESVGRSHMMATVPPPPTHLADLEFAEEAPLNEPTAKSAVSLPMKVTLGLGLLLLIGVLLRKRKSMRVREHAA